MLTTLITTKKFLKKYAFVDLMKELIGLIFRNFKRNFCKGYLVMEVVSVDKQVVLSVGNKIESIVLEVVD